MCGARCAQLQRGQSREQRLLRGFVLLPFGFRALALLNEFLFAPEKFFSRFLELTEERRLVGRLTTEPGDFRFAFAQLRIQLLHPPFTFKGCFLLKNA